MVKKARNPRKTKKAVKSMASPREEPAKKTATISEISKKIDRVEDKIDDIMKKQEETEDDVEESVDTAEDIEKDVEDLDKDIEEMDDDIDRIEESVASIKRFSITRKHMMEIARGVAGAFVGISIGMGLRVIPILAGNIEILNAIGILIFIMFVGIILIYKNEKYWIKKEGRFFIARRVIQLFVISIAVEFTALSLFNMIPPDPELMFKILVVGSYPAMAGAITFSIA